MLDRGAGPYPETEGERIRERRKERQRRAVPKADNDKTGRVWVEYSGMPGSHLQFCLTCLQCVFLICSAD